MKFDVFHSLSRSDAITPRLGDREVFEHFLSQLKLSESLQFSCMWIAESHFSSETQKRHPNAVIPNYLGEVGLNADSMQLLQLAMAQTQNIDFGTAIHNIVGGSGGPIASADRVRSLIFLNDLQSRPRNIYLGFAAGRFPYINRPFGIFARDEWEQKFWPETQRAIFLEATEIFLRLSLGQILESEAIAELPLEPGFFRSQEDYEEASKLRICFARRWVFDCMSLVPQLSKQQLDRLHFVLGSHDPLAQKKALSFTDIDLFNLSFTPPSQINSAHSAMAKLCSDFGRKTWNRGRMPRTVLVFIDSSRKKAQELADRVISTYIEAMRGTVQLPPKDVLLERALIGDPAEIVEQLQPDHPKSFHKDDRIMLWFEFNQSDNNEIRHQMKLFAEQVIPRLS